MSQTIRITPRPEITDTIQLRDIQLPLPAAPEAWHRPTQRQPCIASLRLSYASSVAAALADDVRLTIDYGKLYRRIVANTSRLAEDKEIPATFGSHIVNVDGTKLDGLLHGGPDKDVRWTAGVITDCALQQLEESAVSRDSSAQPAIQNDFGQFEVRLHLPKAILRAEGGLEYCSVTALGHEATAEPGRRLVVLEEEFGIKGIRCHCILGINPHERVEKQAVNISLRFKGPGLQQWGSTVIETYQDMVRAVAEHVETTSFGSVETLAAVIARIVTMEFSNEEVTVLVEKPSALAFVEGSGLEITRSRGFYQKQEEARSM